MPLGIELGIRDSLVMLLGMELGIMGWPSR